MPRQFWSMRNLNNSRGELILYGEIAQETWYGDEITPQKFFNDLKALGNITELDVRINSPGGDIFAAKAIGNYLRTLNVTKIGYNDGICASSATYILDACDKRYMAVDALFYIHDPLVGLYGYYNKEMLEKSIEEAEILKESIISTYVQKSNLSREEIYEMMANETLLSAEEAKSYGFVDEILNEKSINPELTSINMSKFLEINGLVISANRFKNFSSVENIINKAKECPTILKTPIEEEKPLNLEELKNKHPQLYQEVLNQGALAERNRIKSIEDAALPGFDDLVNDAKYKNCVDAGQLSLNIIQKQKQLGKSALNNMEQDAAEIEATADTAPDEKAKANQQTSDAVNLVAGFFKNRKAGTKNV